ncbi:MAG: bifunctional 3-demethylubiquinone-9 3-methyltransferase/ 2-octaprenyl-6-hydroxy phenol methylase [Methanocella sp. PtaU1.Bin125]|nr:MAG: bifunctional 3-demethylubiquinone-9 3-methyltransferase/ 2-octaprenyl-6-hydroxy phenol methylase [Methanocella sp. PtaU1.Bin125]
MDCYEGLSARFDRLMDWDRRRLREGPFFRRLVDRGLRTFLDCHCGTGFHCALLTDMGCSVEGVDVSPHMIEVASRNLRARGLDISLHLCDVKEMQIDRQFDCVLSMGNSLPHEFGDENLLRTLRRMHEALKPGGQCVVHIENFDRLYADGDRFIPSRFSRKRDGAEAFIFAIDYFEGRVVFNILSIIEENGVSRFNVDVVEYNPLSCEKMRALLSDAGFMGIEAYGDFALTPLDESESYDAIFIARK